MQFSGAFWATLQRFQMASHSIDSLLSSEETKLEDVLNDDSVVQEIRSQNQKLINFIDSARLFKLIELITVFPEDLEDKKRCQNHPFIACEILTESSALHDKIVESYEHLSALFGLLSAENPHSTLIGYFSKVVLSLISSRFEKVVLFIAKHEFYPKLLGLVQHKAISDIIAKTLVTDFSGDSEVLAYQRGVLKDLVSVLKTGNELQTLNASEVLFEMFSKIPDYSVWKDLLLVLLEQDQVEVIYDSLKDEEHRSAAAAGVLKNLFVTCVKINLYSHMPELDINSSLGENIESLNEQLNKKPARVNRNTMMADYQPLGKARLRIIELISSALKQDNEKLIEKIEKSGILRTITGLFFEYPWNSLLHNTFDSIFQTTLLNRNPMLVSSLLLNPDLISRILSECQNTDKKHRKGNLGFIHKISNYLKCTNIPAVQEFLSGNPQWTDFLANYLNERNVTELKQLGEVAKNEPSSSSEEPEIVLPNTQIRQKRFASSEESKPADDDNKPGDQEVDEPEGDDDRNDERKEAENNEPEGLAKTEQELEPKIGEPEDVEIKEGAETELSNEKKAVSSNKDTQVTEPEPVSEGKDRNGLSIDVDEEIHPSPLQLSPLARRRSGSGSKSPTSSQNFSHVNYWKIEILVDELDGLDLE